MDAFEGRLHVVGVRHHSPACAHLVRHVIETVRPRHVLIEGPSDLNERMSELELPHAFPVAIFTYYQDAERRHASWTPFCSYSPEWIAIEAGRSVGAEVRFCDLPAWHPAFEGRANRYADRDDMVERARTERALRELTLRTHTDDIDALWDHLFEQPTEKDELARRLETYFEHLRSDAKGGERDEPREARMAHWVAWALHNADASSEADASAVVLVCGGWHAPRVKRDALTLARASAIIEMPPPERVSEVDSEGRPIRHGSYLVPYSYKRLDAFAGYESGMPSPAYHEWVFDDGHERAAERAMAVVTERVRKRKQPLSTADLIAARSLASALARLRGHTVTMRTDVLDGLAGALVKEGMEVPFPWARRGTISPRTEPVLVEVVRALSGDREGKLASGTPRPPLAADVRNELERHGLALTSSSTSISISLRDAEGRAKSRVLHRLRVLGIPGFSRDFGPNWATGTQLDETWTLASSIEQDAALIEASQWGATLEGAALARLEAELLEARGRLGALARVLGIAVFVGISGLEAGIIAEVARAVSLEPSLAELGSAASRLLDLTLHGELFGADGAQQIAEVLIAAFDRGLWLLEGMTGATAPLDEGVVLAVVALRDLLRRGPADLRMAGERSDGVFSRRAVDTECPPSIRGACLGALWSLERLGEPEIATEHAVRAVRGAALPNMIGDFLSGLFATARVEVLGSGPLIAAIDQVLVGLGDHEMMVALPSLRLAFGYFPPRERERIARTVLGIHGGDVDAAHGLVSKLRVQPSDIALGFALDRAVTERARRYGLVDALDGEEA
jgi:hypothetical protein